MSQPLSGNNWTAVNTTDAGTAIISNIPSTLVGVYFPGATTGTLTIHDSASGTSAKTLPISNNNFDFPDTVNLNISMAKGIVAVSSAGTIDAYLIWH